MSREEEWQRTKDRMVTLLFDKGAVGGSAYTVTRETIGELLELPAEDLESALRQLSGSEGGA